MKRSTKITSTIVAFFLIITIVIVGRAMIGNHFKKKFSKRPPPGVIVKEVVYKSFSENIESFGTAVSKRTESFRIKRDNLTSELILKDYVKKGDLIVKLKDKNIVFTCGSGVTASVLALAYSLINNKYTPTIYDGSWSEYGKN